MKRRKVLVEYTFATRPAPAPDAPHNFRPEGIPTKRIYCYGCWKYFKDWNEVFKFHKKLLKKE